MRRYRPRKTKEARPAAMRACRRISRRLTEKSSSHLSQAGRRLAFGRIFQCRLFKNYPNGSYCP